MPRRSADIGASTSRPLIRRRDGNCCSQLLISLVFYVANEDPRRATRPQHVPSKPDHPHGLVTHSIAKIRGCGYRKCASDRVHRGFYAEASVLFFPPRPSNPCTARPASSRPSNPAASVGAGHAGVSETVTRWDSPVCAPAQAQPRAAQDARTQGPQDGEA